MTANPIPEEHTGGYLAVELPAPYEIALYKCTAWLEFEDLPCATIGPRQLRVKIPTDFFEEKDIEPRTQYEIIIDLQAV